MLRIFDVIISFSVLVCILPLILVVFLCGFFDTGAPLFFQKRLGKNKKGFTLVKFRTMKLGTLSVGTHLASASSVTKLGSIWRRTKIDELPQLLNVIRGDMSLVGPRPNLSNQSELIAARQKLGVYDVRPGITGLAQVSGIDMSTPELLAKTDAKMIESMSVMNYFRYLVLTVIGKGAGDRLRV